MFANEQLTSQMEQLFTEGRNYWNLQKQYLSLHSAEILTRLLSTLVLVLVLLLVGSMVLLFGSFALAFWLGEVLDSSLLGFGIIALVLLLIVILVWANYKVWIVRPITRFVVNLLVSSLTVPSQEAIALEKSHLREQLEDNQRELKETATKLLSPTTQTKSGWDNVATWLQNGLTVYRGIQVGASAIMAIRSIFKLGRKKK